jgi:hypothetical protein
VGGKANMCKSKLPNSMESLKRLIRAAMFLVMTSEFCIHPCKQRMRSLLDCGDAMVSMKVKKKKGGGEERRGDKGVLDKSSTVSEITKKSKNVSAPLILPLHRSHHVQ